MPCLAYRRAAVRNAGSPVKPATDASHACGDSRFSTAEWGKFAVDSPLEGDGFEPSVPHEKQPFLAPPRSVPAIRLP